jgi:tetratricopeptide (TPR) repeat protein
LIEELSGRLYVVMEYIPPDEQGLNTLEGYLRRRPPDLAQSLRWGIQFCHGMEHAYSKGIRSHRDIKPADIMISQDGTVKIADFGLASVLGEAKEIGIIGLNVQDGLVGLSGQTMEGTSFGTPTHMPPEQFSDAAQCDERSDIYAFGVVLYQMATGGELPFLAQLPRDGSDREALRFWQDMHRLHSGCSVPKVDCPLLLPIIQCCLAKDPDRRYQSFRRLRSDLEVLLKRQTGETIRPPKGRPLDAWEWTNKGSSLSSLGRVEEAIDCYDRAIETHKRSVGAWSNKGSCLYSLGRHEEAIGCLDTALGINPHHAGTWTTKGLCLASLGRLGDAIHCHDKALELDPQYTKAWSNKGIGLHSLGRYEEAIHCFSIALQIDAQYSKAWSNRGLSLAHMGRFGEAISCYDKALQIDPQYAKAWNNRGLSLVGLGRLDEALRCYDRALNLDPQYASPWFNKALVEDELGQTQDAIHSYQQFVALAPAQRGAQVEHARQRLQCLEVVFHQAPQGRQEKDRGRPSGGEPTE